MAYSTSPETLRRILHKLEPMTEGRSVQWAIEAVPGAAERWAYKVREGLAIALLYPEQFPELARYASQFTVEVLAPNAVMARFSPNTPEPMVVSGAQPTPVHGLQTHSKPGGPIIVPNVTTAFDIINYWLRAQPTNDPMRFPDALLDDDELGKLATWAAQQTPRWMVVKAQHENALTLMKYDPTVPSAAVVRPRSDGT